MTPHFLGDDARRIGDAALGVDADLGRDAVPGPRLQARAQPLHDVCMLRGPVKRKHTKARHPPLFYQNCSLLVSNASKQPTTTMKKKESDSGIDDFRIKVVQKFPPARDISFSCCDHCRLHCRWTIWIFITLDYGWTRLELNKV